jgi:nitrate/TMAO reductase-like tetraheme cytochrome c subunit
MKANDSAECRHCHSVAAMDGARQNEVARAVHPAALKAGSTCIDCHKGIAHKLPDAKNVAALPAAAPAPAAPATPAGATAPAIRQASSTLPAPTPATTQAPAKTPHPAVTSAAACLTCHKGVTDQPIRPGQSPDPAKKHPVGIRDGVDCMLCHKTPGQVPGQ